MTVGRYFACSTHATAVNVIGKKILQPSEARLSRSFMYYVNDGVYGSFNGVLYEHATPSPALLEVSGPLARKVTLARKVALVHIVIMVVILFLSCCTIMLIYSSNQNALFDLRMLRLAISTKSAFGALPAMEWTRFASP